MFQPAEARREPARLVALPPRQTARHRLSGRTYALLLVAAGALGLVVRASFVLSSDFPLNDGGLFVQMTRDLAANDYRLPAFTTYNAADIPFAYPPFAFYLAAALEALTPLDTFDIYRYVPLAASALLLLPFWALARRLLVERTAVVTAVAIFAVLPPTFLWMVMGGGMTRAVGFVFALTAIAQVVAMYREPRLWRPLVAGIAAGLTILTHLEMGWFAAVSCAVMFFAWGRSREGISNSAAVCVVAALVAAPWYVAVIAMHGPDPFVEAAFSGSMSPLFVVAHLIEFRVTGEPLFAVFGALALLGIFSSLARRQYLLPAWVVACALLDPRAFATSASTPAALLAAVAIHDVLVPFATRFAAEEPSVAGESGPAPSWLLPAFLLSLTVYGFLGAFISSPGVLTGMTRDERAAMAWVTGNTNPEDRFVIVSGDAWPIDRTSEWFPALTGRRSIATVQGYEWIDGGFRSQITAYVDLQECADEDAACLHEWSATYDMPYDYVYIPKLPAMTDDGNAGGDEDDCCQTLLRSLREDPAYALVYDDGGAAIFERVAR